MKKILFVTIASIFFMMPQTTLAAEFKVFDQGAGIISKEESVKNLYTGGNSVTTNADVKGDLTIFANSLTINGGVESDLFAAGNTINIKGQVGENARVAGSTVTVENNIGEDLLAAAGILEISGNSTINGDVLATGGTITINGKVNGNIKASADTLIINGEINGDVLAKNVKNLEIKENAKINGKLTYYSPKEAKISNLAQIGGGVTYNEVKPKNLVWQKASAVDILYRIISSFVVLLVLIYGFSKFASKINSETYSSFWSNLGWGIIAFIITPIIMLLLALSIIGAKIAIIMALAYIGYLILASIFVPIFIGTGIISLATKNKEFRLNWISAAIGVVASVILGSIPLIGWLAIFIIFIASFGTLTKLSYTNIKNK